MQSRTQKIRKEWTLLNNEIFNTYSSNQLKSFGRDARIYETNTRIGLVVISEPYKSIPNSDWISDPAKTVAIYRNGNIAPSP